MSSNRSGNFLNRSSLHSFLITIITSVILTTFCGFIFLRIWEGNRLIAELLLLAVVLLNTMFNMVIRHKLNEQIQIRIDILHKLAQGNLLEFEIDSRHSGELGEMGRTLKSIVDEIRFLMKQLGYTADLVAESSVILDTNACEAAKATAEIATAIQEIANGTDRQHRETNEVSRAIWKMSEDIKTVVANIDEVMSFANNSANTAENGSSHIKNAIKQMGTIEKTTQVVYEAIDDLNNQSLQIKQIVDTISQIASQTNLLALNAAIEAARAGEHGKGFAVVADEVRKLAEQSQIATKEIAGIIQSITKSNADAVQVMNNGKKEVAAGFEIVNLAGQIFSEVNQMANSVSEQVNQIFVSVKSISESGQIVSEKMNVITNITKETATHAETVSAATQQHAASSEDTTSASQNLAYMSLEMQGAVNAYIVE
ncbi:MAG: methyl-accepting chemotaxis protein [Desulfosporosinus sp.]|nr:methyl-accepting chemotaxis protein [Desulfosporosinus sp.]